MEYQIFMGRLAEFVEKHRPAKAHLTVGQLREAAKSIEGVEFIPANKLETYLRRADFALVSRSGDAYHADGISRDGLKVTWDAQVDDRKVTYTPQHFVTSSTRGSALDPVGTVCAKLGISEVVIELPERAVVLPDVEWFHEVWSDDGLRLPEVWFVSEAGPIVEGFIEKLKQLIS